MRRSIDNYYELLGLSLDATDEVIRSEVNARIRVLQERQHLPGLANREQVECDLEQLFHIKTVLLSRAERNNYDRQLSEYLSEQSHQILESEKESNTQLLPQSSAAQYSVALLIDTSGSMSGEPLVDAKRALVSFLNGVTVSCQFSLVEFADPAKIVSRWSSDKKFLIGEIDHLGVNGATGMHLALKHAQGLVDEASRNKTVIVLCTDGCPTDANEDTILQLASTIKDGGTRIVTVGIGAGVNSDFLRRLASKPEDYLFAEVSLELEKIYSQVARGIAEIN